MLNITKKDLTKIKEPLRYTGGEYGEVIKNESEIQIRVALCYPNLYDIGMNNYTMIYLYNELNSRKGIYAERFFMPDLDIEKLLINNNQNLFSLETKKEMNCFDFAIFVLHDEIEYINVVCMLKLSKMNNKDNKKTIIIGMIDNFEFKHYGLDNIFDIFVYENKRVIYNDILFRYGVYKSQKLSRSDYLHSINSIKNVIVPCIDSNKKIEMENKSQCKIQNEKIFPMIPVSNISSINQRLNIKYNSNILKLYQDIIKLIKNTGITNLNFVNFKNEYENILMLIKNLKKSYPFLKITIQNLLFSQDTLEIYNYTGMISSNIKFEIFSKSIKRKELDYIMENIELAIKNGVKKIHLKVNIGCIDETYHDLEKLSCFINKIKEKVSIYSTVKFSVKFCYEVGCNIENIELKEKFLKEKLNNVNFSFEDINLVKLRGILKTPNADSSALIDKVVNSGIRVYNENLDLDLLKLKKLFMELEM